MRTLTVLALFFLAIQARNHNRRRVQEPKNDRLKLELISHRPCPWSRNNTLNGKWIEQIRFPSFNGAPLIEDKHRPGCYKIGGDVWVKRPLHANLQLHLQFQQRVSDNRAPEACINADPRTGCGGLGSCLYCDKCRAIDENKSIRVTKASVEVDGKPLECKRGLNAGFHHNIYLRFCLPTKREFLRSQGITEEVWKEIANNRGDTGENGQVGMFLNIRIFNSHINNLMKHQIQLERYQREQLRIAKTEPLPRYIYDQLPFNQLLNEEKGFIGCHSVYGNLFLKDD